ncbi:ras-GEF domain-containing family member 1B-like [Dysidea avara]|uniref:ras-GEF domain-containing family member 1B-like n=1 Tax=Dysidea avara TaxID=196820 RepID=UPI00332CB3D6
MDNPASRRTAKDLLGVQLEVTERLLQSEEAKLAVLKNELDSSGGALPGGTKAKELEAQQNNYARIHTQFQRLSQELRQVGLQAISQKPGRPLKASRSLPAIGIKATNKRPSVFDSLVPSEQQVQGDPLDETPPKLNYKDGVIVSGSLEALLEEFYPTATHYPDHSYIFAFLLCIRLFWKPHELLARVSRLTQVYHHKSTASPTENNANKIIELMGEWTEIFPYDFRDERMMRHFKEITQLCARQSAELRKAVGQIQQTLVKTLSVLDKYEHILVRVNEVAMERLSDHQGQVNILEVTDDPQILAQQLCHVELERLNNIGPEEFVQTFVKEVKETEPLFRDMKKTRNLEAYVEWFNRLSYLVSTEICVPTKKHDRVRVYDFFIQTALHCYKINNFNSCLAVLIGLNMTPVSRLKKTLSKVNMSPMEEVEHLMDPTSNFGAYRSCLLTAVSSVTQDKQQANCVVPVFSLLLKDIYFLNEANKNKCPNGLINFEKFWALSRLITQVLSYKNTNYPQERVKTVLNYLMTVPVCTEDELYYFSYECESPETSMEKKRYAEIRSSCQSIRVKKKISTASMSSTSSSPPPY